MSTGNTKMPRVLFVGYCVGVVVGVIMLWWELVGMRWVLGFESKAAYLLSGVIMLVLAPVPPWIGYVCLYGWRFQGVPAVRVKEIVGITAVCLLGAALAMGMWINVEPG